ncbi:wall-associated receptor kinase-like 1 [Bidens hawaiensis]|uniref:wall-associated receptor kinase-like 1 n=1 Tax=Bidens hawaiensis TaxID=980011 RepID=UPI00404B8008
MKLFQAYHLLILFSLTTASASVVPRYAKPGCKDTCGNVLIPYPFGIGAGCSVNKWYIIQCNSSTPYLSAFKHLHVLGINLENQTVIVKMPKYSACRNPVANSMSIDLDMSPFLFSKSHNKFVFEGCGNAVMMGDASQVLAGCSTNCIRDIVNDRNNCFGISCCQTAIPSSLQYYNISITGQGGDDRSCGSAFLVDENSYVSEDNNSFVPVSLLWTLSQDGIDQVRWKFTPATKREFTSFVVNADVREAPKFAKPGCTSMCGNVIISYPFGIGVNCSVNKWYIIDCKSSTPYLSAVGHLEVLGINTANQTITVNTPKVSACQNATPIMNLDLGLSSFLYSKAHNKFVFEGCGNAIMMDQGNRVLTGCSTNCHDATPSNRNKCFGTGCCQTTIPRYLKSYSVNITTQAVNDKACGPAFLVDETSYVEGRFSYGKSLYVPVSLLWTLSESDIHNVSCYYSPGTLEVDLGNGTTVKSWTCQAFEMYSHYYMPQGNPYVADGLIDTEDCSKCKDSGSYCLYDTTYYYDADYLIKLKLSCIGNQRFALAVNAPTIAEAPKNAKAPNNNPEKDKVINSRKTSLGLILGISISIGVPFIVATTYLLYKVIKKANGRRRRNRFFKRNGGLLLKQQEADPSIVNKTTLFTSRELKKATDNFNENKVLGRGGQGTVYKGILGDGRILAVKKSKVVDESQLEQFINEVLILSQINHRNVVKLLGCCLETEVPLLVSEFIPNGTLYDRLHSETNEAPISFETRLQIATEVAGALAYLHSATSLQIYHRDIKTTNILLDDKLKAKVSDFGTSRFVAIDKSHLTTLVKGTFGYLDPEYFQSSQFTEKSDVYSFGVVLVELLTGEKPISLARSEEHRSLATYFMLSLEEGSVMSILDVVVINEGSRDEFLAVANLAMRCLNLNGKNRPTMKEVATELETIRTSHIASIVQTSMEQ